MEVRYYPAIVERAVEGFGISFPDFPGCVSAGETIDETARNGEDALRLHVRGMTEDGDTLPAPTALEAIPRDPELDEVARLLVRVELPGKSVRLNISLDESLVEAIDRAAAAQGLSRSGFLAGAARQRLREEV